MSRNTDVDLRASCSIRSASAPSRRCSTSPTRSSRREQERQLVERRALVVDDQDARRRCAVPWRCGRMACTPGRTSARGRSPWCRRPARSRRPGRSRRRRRGAAGASTLPRPDASRCRASPASAARTRSGSLADAVVLDLTITHSGPWSRAVMVTVPAARPCPRARAARRSPPAAAGAGTAPRPAAPPARSRSVTCSRSPNRACSSSEVALDGAQLLGQGRELAVRGGTSSG